MSKTVANFTANDLKPLSNMTDLVEAKEYMNEIIDRMCPPLSNHPINPSKAVALRQSILKVTSVSGLQKMGWNMLLSGFKMGNPDSKYQQRFKVSKVAGEDFQVSAAA